MLNGVFNAWDSPRSWGEFTFMPVTLVVPVFYWMAYWGGGLATIRLPSSFTGGAWRAAPFEFVTVALNYLGLTVPDAPSFDLLEFDPDLWNLLPSLSILLCKVRFEPSPLSVTAEASVFLLSCFELGAPPYAFSLSWISGRTSNCVATWGMIDWKWIFYFFVCSFDGECLMLIFFKLKFPAVISSVLLWKVMFYIFGKPCV